MSVSRSRVTGTTFYSRTRPEGGVDIGDVDAKGLVLNIPVMVPFPSLEKIADTLLKYVPAEKKETLIDFVIRVYSVHVDLHFAYLEFNPPGCP